MDWYCRLLFASLKCTSFFRPCVVQINLLQILFLWIVAKISIRYILYWNYIKQVNYIINNFLPHHKKRYLFRFIDDNN